MHWGRASRPTSNYIILLTAVFALGFGSVKTAISADDLEIENLRVGFVNSSQNNLFKVGTWTPLAVQIKGTAERFSGIMEVEVPDDDGTPTFFRQTVDVPAGSSTRVVTYARPGSRDPNFLIRFFDERGKRKGPVFDGSRIAQLSPIMADETMILTLGNASGVDQIPGLPGFATDKNSPGQEVQIARVETTGGLLPARWYGFDAADSIVLDTNDKDLMAALAVRGQALVDWVSRGGHLVVSVGANWQAVRDSLLGPILPAVPTGQVRLNTLAALETYSNATKPIMPPASATVLASKLEQVDERGGKVLSATADVPLIVRGAHGFGRITVIAIDVDQKPFAEWPDRAMFWLRACDLKRQASEATNTAVRVGGGGRPMAQSGINDLSTRLRVSLEQFPGVKLIPFGWVAFFIFLYILLIGPGDYFFLKKVLKRMELTWVTFPLIVITVSLVAYFAAYFVKGRDLRVNKVDVVDIDQTSGSSRGSTYVNLFSPQNRDYDVSVLPQGMDRAAGPAVSISSPGRPAAGTEVLLSWLGVPETGFGGMGSSGRMGFGGGGYASQPPGGSEKLEGVRIPIWSTKLLSARWYGPIPPVADSDLVSVGSDRLAGTVTNRLDIPMTDAVLAFGKQVYTLGTINPGASVQVELMQNRQLSGMLKAKSEGYRKDEFNGSGSRINRADLMFDMMFHDGRSSSASDRTEPSIPLHYLDLTGLLSLDRPMLVARVDRPGATLVLENASVTPKVDQTTMLRVILPLGKSK